MPKYTFVCPKCHTSFQKYASVKNTSAPCECGDEASRQMPNISGTRCTETVDKLLNRKHTADQAKTTQERKLNHYWTVEVPNMVNSGIYSIETMLQQGWVYYNEKGELTTRTKPVQKT